MQRSVLFVLAFVLVPLIVGCDGCRQQADKEKPEDENAPRAAYTPGPTLAFPADRNTAFSAAKPGHWITASQAIRSNKDDVRGELRSIASMRITDEGFKQIAELKSDISSRPATLVKGQMRDFDFRLRVPTPMSVSQSKMNLSSQLVPRNGGLFDTGQQPINLMRSTEFFFVVLTTRPERFAKWQTADWVRPVRNEFADKSQPNYRIVFPATDGVLPLPETMLDLTSTAVVVWDDLSEDALTPLQQTALIDWVHFGGRLIVNGPSASEAVAKTKLQSLLALKPSGNVEMDHDGAEEMLRGWAVKSDRSIDKQVELMRSESSRIAIDGQMQRDAQALPDTGSLILQRRVGRGHVVQPRIDLTEAWIDTWDSYQSFINGLILRRPARTYAASKDTGIEGTFQDFSQTTDEDETPFTGLVQTFEGTDLESDAAANSQFRLTSRDAALRGADATYGGKMTSPYDRFTRVDPLTGISGWKDNSDTIQLFRDTLSKEAGIEIPGSKMVIRSLAIYLAILVPLNYLFFRIIGRLEYAWLAVPVIAVGGAIWAARQAQLDIGFARSNTELALLETHQGYNRGHVSRLIAVYNSLSSRYNVQFKTVDGAAATLEGEPNSDGFLPTAFQTSYDEGPSLSNFAVPSNRLRFLHAEQILDLGGEFTWSGGKITNDTDHELLDAVVVSKNESGELLAALVGQIEPGEQVNVNLRSMATPEIPSALPMNMSQLIRQFASSEAIPSGSTRLVGRIDGDLPGMEIAPSASQHAVQTLVLVHLQHADLPEPARDANLATEFVRVRRSVD
ncbi:hypothetical protein [Stieleria varia]|uniref:Uncharacterized protein n=1 Tax=Stieleria varia TaxID=2528005 RepID=A0A5C6B7H7_9BACT|nr:hypothetical protein [Stieleria varia]TWU07757.1 hypothetical protein Pla52n_03300 [Stieleria varia]